MSARQDRRDKIASRAVQIGFVVALIGLWYFGTAYWGISRILLPNPVNVWHELKDVIGSGEFLPDLRKIHSAGKHLLELAGRQGDPAVLAAIAQVVSTDRCSTQTWWKKRRQQAG